MEGVGRCMAASGRTARFAGAFRVLGSPKPTRREFYRGFGDQFERASRSATEDAEAACGGNAWASDLSRQGQIHDNYGDGEGRRSGWAAQHAWHQAITVARPCEKNAGAAAGIWGECYGGG